MAIATAALSSFVAFPAQSSSLSSSKPVRACSSGVSQRNSRSPCPRPQFLGRQLGIKISADVDKHLHYATLRRRAVSVTASAASAAAAGDADSSHSTGTHLKTAHEVPGFSGKRLLVFASIILGYSSYYITRNSLTFTAPVMVATESLGIKMTDIGVITSIFPMCYGFSKFFSGVVSQKLSPKLMLAGGLMVTGLLNILFSMGNSLPWFSASWALNGMLQGFGAVSCAKIITSWFATKERGTYWGMWNIAHNIGGFSAPIIAGTAARTYGWKYGLLIPGAIGVIVSSILFLICKDSPESSGYPPVEYTLAEEKAAAQGVAVEKKQELTLMQNLMQNVLSNPFIWGLALTYFCVYLIRQAVTSWAVFYLMNVKGVTDAAQAAIRVSGLELGGLCGSLVAGVLSDKLAASAKGAGTVGRRVRVVMAYLVGVAAALVGFWNVPQIWWMQAASIFSIGFFLYGPQMLIGLCGAEIVGRDSVGASEGFLGWVAYLGAANAGVPLSMIVSKMGWDVFFFTLLGACGIALLLLAPMVNAKSFVEREAATAAE